MLFHEGRGRALKYVISAAILLAACGDAAPSQSGATGAVTPDGTKPDASLDDARVAAPEGDAGDGNGTDRCPDDPNKQLAGACGCDMADTDSDSDGTPDCKDECSSDAAKTTAGECGCGNTEESCKASRVCASAAEGETLSLACPGGHTIHAIEFASYGTASGSCDADLTLSACHASVSTQRLQTACLGKQSCSVTASNATFGDPCGGATKRLAVRVLCSEGEAEAMSVFLLAGQSNMVGNVDASLFDALLSELTSGPAGTTQTRLKNRLQDWYLNNNDGYAAYGYSDAMASFESAELIRLRDASLAGTFLKTPLSNITCAMNSPTVTGLTSGCGSIFGPELVLGHYLSLKERVPTSLIKVAKGGTTLYADWRSPKTVTQSGGVVGPLYTQLQDRIDSLKTAPESVHPQCVGRPCRWAGFIWFQGENDSMDQAGAGAYAKNLANLIADVRGRAENSNLPVVIVEIGKWAQSMTYGSTVRSAQQTVVAADAHARLVKSDDLSGFYHYDPAAQMIIGERVGIALESLLP